MANMRISGIMSGFDTDTMIKDLMKAESMRVDNVKKSKQFTVWQQESIREITNKLKTFQSNYFDVLKSNQNMGSTSSFSKFNYTVQNNGLASTKVNVVANADVKSKTQTINEITKLASKDTWTGNSVALRGLKTEGFNLADMKTDLDTANKDLEFTIAIGNQSKIIKIAESDVINIADNASLVSALNQKIEDAFGANFNSVVSEVSGELKFDMVGSTVKILKYGENTVSLDALGVTSGQSSTDYRSKTIGELFGLNNTVLQSITVNGKSFALDSGDTIDKMMSKINGSEANVTIAYDSLSDKFTMTSKSEGSANNILIDNNSNAETLFSKIFNAPNLINDLSGEESGISRVKGDNAILKINDIQIVQGNNTFTLDGMTYTLNETSLTPITIGVDTNTTEIVDNIKNFVKEYNELIDFVSGKLSEKKDYDYEPLTDEEKEALSEDEIKLWESKAKSGILRGSSELSTMLTQFRNAIVESTSGLGLTMDQIGIKSTSYTDRGKLTIDEDKLKSAIENNFDDVVSLFTKKSEVAYTDIGNKTTRFKENGVATRFDDILKDYIRTTRDTNGNKGILIMKAGIENDTSAFSNSFTDKITGYDDRISDLLDDLESKEEYYYIMFSKMESALSQMESQSASLMSQLGS